MRPSVYVMGGAAVGKSTFTLSLLDEVLGVGFGELEDLHSKPNAKPHGNTGVVVTTTLRGHKLYEPDWPEDSFVGWYVGVRRDKFPGSDGLARSNGPVIEEWLRWPTGNANKGFIISEGQTLGTRRVITALHETTRLLVVHMVASTERQLAQYAERGEAQTEQFLRATVTKPVNLLRDLAPLGLNVLTLDVADELAYELSQDICATHLRGRTDTC